LQLLWLWLGGGEHLVGFAEQVFRPARLGQDMAGLRHLAQLLSGRHQIGEVSGEDKDGSGELLAGEFDHEFEAVAPWHGDVAEDKGRGEFAGLFEGLVYRVGDLGLEALLRENDAEGVGSEAFIVDDKNSLHSPSKLSVNFAHSRA